MKQMQTNKIIYYEDELHDEFSTAKITPRVIDENYQYLHHSLWNFFSFLLQNVISMPIKVFYAKIKFHHCSIGKEKLKKYRKQGYFIYGNHTQQFADTFLPSLGNYPKRNFFIVNPENISMKGLGTLVELLGAIPIPGNKTAMKHFLQAVEKRLQQKSSITIYPEAHIWPYYTKIRPFLDVSFQYPIKYNVPTFCMTNTYQARGKKKNKVKIVTYIDGPFFADSSLSKKEAQKILRNQVLECMTKRSKANNIEYIKYVKIEKPQEKLSTVVK